MSASSWFAHLAPVLFLLSASAAAPPLTTVQDTLYKADGTRFWGVATFEWKSFEASDRTPIAMQTVSVPIANGVLRVQLVPTTNASPGASYHVRYSSDGKIQFDETWAVPPSNTPLRIRDVRISTGSTVTPPAPGTLIQESEVSGLPADLAVRPVKGAGYYPSRVAFVSSSGAIESVTGGLSECVRVDGTTAPCGSWFADNEIPQGTLDGQNAVFSLAGTPSPAASLAVHRNGVLQQRGLDFELSGSTITFAAGAIPQYGDTLLASYRSVQAVAQGGSAFAQLGLSASLTPGIKEPVRSGPPAALEARGVRGSAPEVLCAGTGESTAARSATPVGRCAIPPGLLRPGDRIEIRLDYRRSGGAGFAVAAKWAAEPLLYRRAPAGESVLTARIDVAVHSAGAQWSVLSWGSLLAPAYGAGALPSTNDEPITLELLARSDAASSRVSLSNYTVLRVPARNAR